VGIYLFLRLLIRLTSALKQLQYTSSSSTTAAEAKVCQAFVITCNQYGSFRPIHSLYRSDSLFSANDFMVGREPQQTDTTLLEHYLRTYNPLHLDLTGVSEDVSPAKAISSDDVPSETDTRPIAGCYPLNCTNKHYQRLRDENTSSANLSALDNHPSECSTTQTHLILPVVMITDCSDSHRLQTEIVEMNEDDE
jgi:hypothetical protein